jgi:PadR family transcriptional regulator, regulatory protein PadR
VRAAARSEGTLSFEDGAVYPLLHAFERDGLAEGYWEDVEGGDGDTTEAAPARRGPRRRYYRLTPAGIAALRGALKEWRAFSGAVGRVLGEQPAVGGEG